MPPFERSKRARNFVSNLSVGALGGAIVGVGAGELNKVFRADCAAFHCGDWLSVLMSLIFTGWPWIGAVVIGGMITVSREVLDWKSSVLATILAWVCTLIGATFWHLNTSGQDDLRLTVGLTLVIEFGVALALLNMLQGAEEVHRGSLEELQRTFERLKEAQHELEVKRHHLQELGSPLNTAWWEAEKLWWADWTQEGVAISQSSAALEIAASLAEKERTLASDEAIWRPRSEWKFKGNSRLEIAKRVKAENHCSEAVERTAHSLVEYLAHERDLFVSALFAVGLAEAECASISYHYEWAVTDIGRTLARKEWVRRKRSFRERWYEIDAKAAEVRVRDEKRKELESARRLAERLFRGQRAEIAAKHLVWVKTWGLIALGLIYGIGVVWFNWK